jgi:hypothetical protein
VQQIEPHDAFRGLLHPPPIAQLERVALAGVRGAPSETSSQPHRHPVSLEERGRFNLQ